MANVIEVTALDKYRSAWASIDEGGLTVAEVVEAHEQLSALHDELEACVSKAYKVKELKARLPHAWSDARKPDLVGSYVKQMLNQFPWLVENIFSQYSGPLQMSGTKAERKAFYRQHAYEGRCNVLERLTPELLAEHVQQVKARDAERMARVERMAEALKNPVTYDDWRSFIRVRCDELGRTGPAEDVLTVDELAEYDAAVYVENEKRHRAHVAQSAKIEQIDTDAALTVEKEWHTKKECDIWVVRLSERVDRGEFKELQAAARRLRARWSRWSSGFIFYDEEKANAFASVTEEAQDTTKFDLQAQRRKEEKAGDRLEQYAIRTDGRATDSLTVERLANTARRAAMADSAERGARWQIAYAATVQSLATALVNGELGPLSGVRYGTDVTELFSVLNRAKFDAQRNVPAHERDDARIEHIAAAKVPYPNLTALQLSRLHRTTHGKRGLGNSRKIVASMIVGTQHDSSVVITRSYLEAEAIMALIEKLGLQNNDEFDWRIDSYKRFKRMGLVTGALLRHAMREFYPHVTTPMQPDPLTVALRNLVGIKFAGYFPTPAEVADHMAALVAPKEGEYGAETSAGTGNLIDAALRHCPRAHVTYYEPVSALDAILTMKYGDNERVQYGGHDGMKAMAGAYDWAMINPPFEDLQDVLHVQRTYHALKSGGRMAAIVSASRASKTSFTQWLDDAGGHIEMELPAGTFHEAGTNVRSVLVYIDKA